MKIRIEDVADELSRVNAKVEEVRTLVRDKFEYDPIRGVYTLSKDNYERLMKEVNSR